MDTTQIFSDEALRGKKALIVGVANERSLAWAIARHLHAAGAELAFTFLGESLERRVRPLAESVSAKLIEPCDINDDAQADSLFNKIHETFGKLDIVVHAVAFANKQDLEGRFISLSREGFRTAMEISAYTLISLTRRAEPLMKEGGTILTLSYLGGERVIPNYNIMGVAKAALESIVRYLAYDLGPQKIRVNAISAGPVKTLAAAGIRDFRTMLNAAAEKTPLRENINAEDVGAMGAFLCTEAGKHITGTTLYIDSGAHIMGA